MSIKVVNVLQNRVQYLFPKICQTTLLHSAIHLQSVRAMCLLDVMFCHSVNFAIAQLCPANQADYLNAVVLRYTINDYDALLE